jgi:hypothetical protein
MKISEKSIKKKKTELYEKLKKRKLQKIKESEEYGLSILKKCADRKYWATSHKNCFRCSISLGNKNPETIKHIIMKFIRFIYHRKLGRIVFTELRFSKGRGRADLVVVDKGNVFIEEIVVSEKEKTMLLKQDKYPFPVKIFNAKELSMILNGYVENAIWKKMED